MQTPVTNKEKGQVIVLDLLLLLIIVLLIILIEGETIIDYKLDIINKEKELDLLKESMIVEQLISDCNLFAKKDNYTGVCKRNNIEIKNMGNLPKEICEISINNQNYFKKGDTKNKYKRGVVYNNNFNVLEVGFCE